MSNHKVTMLDNLIDTDLSTDFSAGGWTISLFEYSKLSEKLEF